MGDEGLQLCLGQHRADVDHLLQGQAQALHGVLPAFLSMQDVDSSNRSISQQFFGETDVAAVRSRKTPSPLQKGR